MDVVRTFTIYRLCYVVTTTDFYNQSIGSSPSPPGADPADWLVKKTIF